jgi:hypothetical protein
VVGIGLSRTKDCGPDDDTSITREVVIQSKSPIRTRFVSIDSALVPEAKPRIVSG